MTPEEIAKFVAETRPDAELNKKGSWPQIVLKALDIIEDRQRAYEVLEDGLNAWREACDKELADLRKQLSSFEACAEGVCAAQFQARQLAEWIHANHENETTKVDDIVRQVIRP